MTDSSTRPSPSTTRDAVPAHRVRSLGAVLLALGLLAGCGSSSATSSASTGTSSATTTTTATTTTDPSSGAAVLAQRRAAGIAACPSVPASATASSSGLPDLTLDCLGGDSRVNLAALANGRPTVLNFWATWCGPCRVEGPLLGQLHRQLGSKVQMVGVLDGDNPADQAIAMAKSYGMTYPMLTDPEQKARVPLRVSALPQTLFLDATGRIVYRSPGAYRSMAALQADVRQHLGVGA